MQPLAAVGGGDDALGPENRAVFAAVQGGEDALQIALGEGLHRLHAPAGEHLVGVMMVMVAAAVGIVALLTVMVMVVMLVVMVMLVVIIVIVVMVMAVLMVVIVVIIVVMVAAVVVVIIVVMVVMMLVLMLRLVRRVLGLHPGQQLVGQRNLLDGAEDGLAVQYVPGGGQDGGAGVLLPQQGHGGLQLLLAQLLRPAEDDRPGGLDLVVVELAEVLHVDLDLGGVGHGDEAVQLHVRHVLHGVLHRHDHVAELAHAGGLDEDAVGVELLVYLLQRLVEVAHQGAADAAGGHLTDLHAAVLQKAAVDADLAELVLDEHQLLALERLRQQLLDQGRLARAQKAGYDVDFCHSENLLFSAAGAAHIFSPISYPIFLKMQGDT